MTDPTSLTQSELDVMAHHVLVSSRFRLVLFTIPKVGCTELIKLIRRMEGASDWADVPHYKPDRPLLSEMSPEQATRILQDESWTKAAVLRDPAERLVSAYLDKFIHSPRSYVNDVFRPGGHGMPFEEFLGYVLDPNIDPATPTGLHHRTDPHWRPQHMVGGLASFEPQLDSVGHFDTIGAWTRRLLEDVGAWDEYGASGWGPHESDAVFESNTHWAVTGASNRIPEFYDAQTLHAVYEAYADDLQIASRFGIDLRRHPSPEPQ
jgi:hypothetical protein